MEKEVKEFVESMEDYIDVSVLGEDESGEKAWELMCDQAVSFIIHDGAGSYFDSYTDDDNARVISMIRGKADMAEYNANIIDKLIDVMDRKRG